MPDFKSLCLFVVVIAAICACHVSAVQFPIADLTADGRVNINDLLILADQWMQKTGGSADIDGLTGVDLGDFQLMAQNWHIYRPTLVINEFMAKNDSFILDDQDQYDDWIEIFNYGSAPVDIGGMYLADDLDNPSFWLVPTSNAELTTIQPDGFLLIWADEDNSPAYPLHANFKLSADGEDIGLYDADYNLIDSVTFEPQNGNESFGRYPDADNNWQVFAEGSATPGTTNAPGIIQQNIIITEIMYHPYHNAGAFEPENTFEEYIELFNSGQLPVELAGWRFADGVDFTFPDVTINAYDYLVVSADPNTFEVLYPSVSNVVGPWTGKLQNKSETITLINQQGGIVDSPCYADEGHWSQRYLGPLDYGHRGWLWSDEHDGGGKSLELINIAMPNQYGQNWAASTVQDGTPGSANSVAVSDTAPLILDVRHNPDIPRSDGTVTVTARIIDELDTGITVTLYYRVDESVFSYNTYPTYDPADYTTVTMLDDGLNGDSLPADGIYTAVIPAHPDLTIIEFFVEADDAAENTGTYPAPVDIDGTLQQVANLLYQVDDSFNPNAEWIPENQPLYYLLMTRAELDRLKYIGSHEPDRYSDAQMNGMFISSDGVDMKLRCNTGIRNRGEGTRLYPPNNYRVNFRHDDPWKDVTAININSKYGYLQCLGSAIFRMASLPAADAAAVQVRVNSENLALTDPVSDRMYGSYVCLEAFDGDYADNHFPDDPDGNIYKASKYPWDADLSYLGTDPADYIEAGYYKTTNEAENDWSDLFELTYTLDMEPDATYVQAVNEIVNIDRWLKWFAAEALIGNNETNLGNGRGDDYYMYCGVEDRRFLLLPHDLDTILGQGDNPFDPADSIFRAADPYYLPVIERFLTHPTFVRRYYAHLHDLTQTVFAPEKMFPLIDQVLAGYVPQSKLDDIKQFILDRNENVLQQIPRQFTINTDLATIGGYCRTTADAAAVYGTADVLITQSVRVNGQLAEWDPKEGTFFIGQSGGSESITLVDTGAIWKYLDDGSDQGTDWYAPDFNDAHWQQGPSKLGYGGDGEVTVVGYGPDPDNKYITTYFRHYFDVQDASEILDLALYLIRDDGAVVYLNGSELQRSNMFKGTITYTTPADDVVGGTDENTFFDYTVNKNLLEEGINVLAVEVHQENAQSSDIGLDVHLIGQIPPTGQVTGIPLDKGLNRIFVQTFDDPNGFGSELQSGYIDIWYDSGSETTFAGGTLPTDTTLDVASSPWQVTADIIVPVDVTLTIEPGTTVFFEAGTGITIYGRLLAEGIPSQRIRLTHVPGDSNWDGLNFQNTLEDNRLCYVDHDYGDAQGQSIRADSAKVLIDNMTWAGTSSTITEMTYPQIIISNSYIPGVNAEPIHGLHLYDDQYLTLEGNIFGVSTGVDDIVDWDTTAEDGIRLRFLNNIFLGGGDDGLDLDGCDAYIEGNVFMNFNNTEPATTSNAVSGGEAQSGAPNTPDYTIVRNIFVNNDHDILLKEEAYADVFNNVFVNSDASIQFCENGRAVDGPAIGAYVDASIFFNCERPFKYILYEDLEDVPWPADPFVAVDNSIITSGYYPGSDRVTGSGNLDADPVFVDEQNDFHLKADSPAVGRGPNGADIGRYIPEGASISGEPYQITHRTTATLTVAGPAITHYKYRLNDNGLFLDDWSEEFQVDAPLELTGLEDGHLYTVYVLGKNSAGDWTGDPDGNLSKTWTVDVTYSRLVINEILAQNSGALRHENTTPDAIELYYDGPAPLSLSGMRITDNPDEPEKFIFGPTTTINPDSYLVLYADDNTTASGIHLGFAINTEGETICLYDNSQQLIDSVDFGAQISNLSIGRLEDGNWALTVPTLGLPNVSQPLGNPSKLKINEWLTNGQIYGDDFIEIYNPNPHPVDLGGMYLTDNPVTQPAKHQIGPLNFVPAFGFIVFTADDSSDDGHVDFRLSADQEMIALYDSELNEIDKVIYYSQTTDVSQGRSPDGTDTYAFFSVPTPAQLNVETIVVNELLAHSHAEAADWIELYNASDEPVDISGWFISDNDDDLFKFEIPEETIIEPNDYVLFYEDLHFGDPNSPGCHTPFALSENGETLYLHSALEGKLTPYKVQEDFGASETGIAFGRYQKSTGTFNFVPMSQNTPGYANAYPKVGPVVINEIMYNPPSGGTYDNDEYEYIELYNFSDTETANLWEYDNELHMDVPWKVVDGIDYTFPLGVSIPAHEYLLVVKNPAAFAERHGSIPGVTILGPYDGQLSNGGEKLELAKPGDELDGIRYYIRVDRINYDDEYFWPTEPDGSGMSLNRITPQDYGNDPVNWNAQIPTPGTVNL